MATRAAENPVMAAALAYAAKGWPVFPCKAETKRPLTENGFHDASTDPVAIRRWWMRHPTAMVACPTGPAVGAWVLDVDDPGVFAAAVDKAGLCLPATARSLTGKGEHIWFAWDDATPIRNAQRDAKGWPFKDLPGAEVRGEGGYVILPPSRHPSGRFYAWQREEEPSEAPDELLAIIAKGRQGAERKAAAGKDEAQRASGGRDTPYGLRALEQECNAVASAPAGAQESTLSLAALKIGGLVAGGQIAATTARARLIAAGLSMPSYNPDDPWTLEAVVGKIERRFNEGTAQPRSPSEADGGDPYDRGREASGGNEPPANDERRTIRIRAGELHLMASEAEDGLVASGAPLFVRGGIVRPIVDEVAASHGKRTKVARLVPVDSDTLVDHLSRSTTFVKFNARKNAWVAADPPHNVAALILSRDGEWTFNQLAGAITAPTLRPDGSLLVKAGYDPQTRLLLLEPPKLPHIADAPSRADAEAALATLDDLLADFPFVDEASHSVALSMLITPVVRGAMPVAPLHAASAPVAGSGKSYLVDLASAILTGERAPVIAAGQTDEETEKRLGSALLNGQPIVSIDNVNGRLGGDALCQLIERPVVSIRPLGVSKLVRIETRATTFATGNNILLVGDMTRRTLLCSLDPNVERPELRRFSTNPFDRVVADRGRFIAAALTVVRAYIAAGYPDALPSLASFEAWSRLVRSALVWLGQADPVDTMEAARRGDPETSALNALLAAWHSAIGTEAKTTGALVDTAGTRNPFQNLIYPELLTALADVAGDARGDINARKLGHYLKARQGRIVGGLRLTSTLDSHTKQPVWRIEVCGVCGDVRGSSQPRSEFSQTPAKSGEPGEPNPAEPRKPRNGSSWPDEAGTAPDLSRRPRF